jgi:hypothetical protein
MGYLMRRNRWTFQQAFDYVKQKRKVVTADRFGEHLKKYEEQLGLSDS